jgi:UDP-glucose 4-epimerase
MKILVTGGAGFIGSHLSETLLQMGHIVHVIDDFSTGKYENIKHLVSNANFSYTVGSILNESMDKIVSNCEQIYHFAAAVGVKNIIDNPLDSMLVNIKGTEIILELANLYKKKILIASSSEVYGKSTKIPYEETDDRLVGSTHISRWSYSSSKAIDEFLALAYNREKKLPIVIARIFNTIGPRQTGLYGMVVPRFVKNALLNHPIIIYGDGKQTRCFCYIDDIICGIIDIMNHKDSIGKIFNIGSNEEISIEDLAKLIINLTNSKSKIEYISYEDAYEEGFEDMRRRIPDLINIINLCNYKINNSIKQSLLKIIQSYWT